MKICTFTTQSALYVDMMAMTHAVYLIVAMQYLFVYIVSDYQDSLLASQIIIGT